MDDTGKTVAMTGAGGLIGSPLTERLEDDGTRVLRLVRREARAPNELSWRPRGDEIDASGLEGVDGVVHLAGEPISALRWTAGKKERIRRSRLDGTRLLATALAGLDEPPEALVCASAMGYYGDAGDELLAEDHPPGEGFLADVCQRWEAAAEPAAEAGIRLVHLRTGLVLSPEGGALGRMLPPFKMGLGGRVGSGEQVWSWIALSDMVGAYQHALDAPELSGPVNAASPNPVTSRAFVEALGRVLGRPTFMPLPPLAVKLLFGEMGDELLLASARLSASKLMKSGYDFDHPELEPALRAALGR